MAGRALEEPDELAGPGAGLGVGPEVPGAGDLTHPGVGHVLGDVAHGVAEPGPGPRAAEQQDRHPGSARELRQRSPVSVRQSRRGVRGLGDEERRDLNADSLLQLASAMAPESWDRPRGQAAHLGWIYSALARIHLGDPEAGIREVKRGLELEARYEDALVGASLRASAARAFVRAGRHDDAIELLESVASLPGMVSRYELRPDPEWDPLRDHPRFLRLAGEVDGQP